MIKPLDSLERFSRVCVWVCGILLFVTAFMIAVEVLLRKIFSVSMGGADEISSYVLAVTCSWSFGYALFHKVHVRIDILYIKLPPKLKAMLDTLALLLFLLYMSTLSYFAFFVLKRSIDRGSTANTPLQTPLWIPQSIWFFGLVVFTLIILRVLSGSVYYQLKGRTAAALELASTSSAEAERDL